jgi:hypothetical protein
MRIPTADDALGVCYLYPNPGELGAACTNGGACNSGLCYDATYCTVACPPDCPLGYSCAAGECVRDQAPPVCPQCGWLACGAGSICVTTQEGASVCTKTCTNNTDCPVAFFCAAGGQGEKVCWPLGNRCDGSAPKAGEPCTAQSECAFNNICVQGPSGNYCYGACRVRDDCADPTAACDILQVGVGYCDKGPAVCTCDTGDGCQPNCPCDAACGCACNTTSRCDDGCACDPDCACPCDVSANCDPGCDYCDPECGGCTCGLFAPSLGMLGVVDVVLFGAAGVVLALLRGRRRRMG